MNASSAIVLLCCIAAFIVAGSASVRYEPNWDSLDKRPLPAWYDEAKFGIFIHWGVFSVPSFGSEWFWYGWATGNPTFLNFMKSNYPPDFTYADFAAQFTAEFYNPDQWADIFKAAGAKYIVLTSKHHEGFTNWPSRYSFNWNAMDVGPKRDLVGDLANSIRNRTDIRFGLYHSLFEWFNPVYNQDKDSGFVERKFVEGKTMPELYEIVNKYKPEVVWSDGDMGPDSYWNSTGFIAWLYNDSPVKDTVVTNDRWGSNGIPCKHGDFYTCYDRYNPGKVLKHKWENCMSIDRDSWGYRRNAPLSSYLSIEELITTLAETVSCGGNLLMNVGPTRDGIIAPIFEERLRQFGSWLAINGEAIYASKPWSHQNDTVTKDLWYTSQITADGETVVYAIVLKWPKNDTLFLGAPVTNKSTKVHLLRYSGSELLTWTAGSSGGLTVSFPSTTTTWAWVLKLENVSGSPRKNDNNLLFKKKKVVRVFYNDVV